MPELRGCKPTLGIELTAMTQKAELGIFASAFQRKAVAMKETAEEYEKISRYISILERENEKLKIENLELIKKIENIAQSGEEK